MAMMCVCLSSLPSMPVLVSLLQLLLSMVVLALMLVLPGTGLNAAVC